MTEREPAVLDPRSLFEALHSAGVDYVLVGGLAVAAHGVIRATKDFDICPAPSPANLQRLASLLKQIDAVSLDLGEFEPDEPPPHDFESLSDGGNFRLKTRLGRLDVIQYLQPFEDATWDALDKHAEERSVFGQPVRVCSYEDLIAMKNAASRDQDLIDITNLKAARRET